MSYNKIHVQYQTMTLKQIAARGSNWRTEISRSISKHQLDAKWNVYLISLCYIVPETAAALGVNETVGDVIAICDKISLIRSCSSLKEVTSTPIIQLNSTKRWLALVLQMEESSWLNSFAESLKMFCKLIKNKHILLFELPHAWFLHTFLRNV